MHRKKICRHMEVLQAMLLVNGGKLELTVLMVLSLMYVMNAYIRDLWNP